MKTTNAILSLALLAVAAACGNTADGVKKDADNAAEKTAEAASVAADKTGEVAGDVKESMAGGLQTGEVKSAIMADTRVSAADINVDTDQDKKTVTLRGSVKTAAEKKLAGEIAADKAIGYSIVNNLSIKP